MMVEVAVTVLVVSDTDPDCETMDITIPGMLSVVKRHTAVVEHQLCFGSGCQAYPES